MSSRWYANAKHARNWPSRLSDQEIIGDAMPIALSLSGIGLRFGGIAALRDVDLTVQTGEIHSVIGPNGAGKSSLLNVLTGIYRPDSGRLAVGDRIFTSIKPEHMAPLGIARTFQNIALFKGLSVTENIAMGLTHHAKATTFEQVFGLPRARREAKATRISVRAIIERLRLGDFIDRPVSSLPYGVKKNVELARALISAPKLLLLDEPMAGMTGGEKADLCGFIRAARDEWNMTIVLVEHDMGVVMSLSDHVTVLDHGLRIAHGTPTQVRADQAVIDAYLGIEETAEPATRDAQLVA
jgi:branched-chain amino acid transport system ATP-binding protein